MFDGSGGNAKALMAADQNPLRPEILFSPLFFQLASLFFLLQSTFFGALAWFCFAAFLLHMQGSPEQTGKPCQGIVAIGGLAAPAIGVKPQQTLFVYPPAKPFTDPLLLGRGKCGGGLQIKPERHP